MTEITVRRYALMRGWARFLFFNACTDRNPQRDREKLRGTDFGIATHDDLHALFYQRTNFRINRAAYAVGGFGLIGKSEWTEDGWKHFNAEELNQYNRRALHRYRTRAHKAKQLLKANGYLPCSQCGGHEFVLLGDQDIPCIKCAVRGIVKLESLETGK